ncbi:YceI family protein [Paracoccus denitrificans]|uniref:YceI family protein n=1 Tax=Paracoccus denitrificans TaxID=266 RepID=UPI003364FA6D
MALWPAPALRSRGSGAFRALRGLSRIRLVAAGRVDRAACHWRAETCDHRPRRHDEPHGRRSRPRARASGCEARRPAACAGRHGRAGDLGGGRLHSRRLFGHAGAGRCRICPRPPPPATVPEAGWAVEQGTLEIEVTQAGSAVAGQFGQWQADIVYDPESRTGRVAVSVDIASLTLGAVSDAAKGPDFLNAAAHPVATFEAEILPPPAEDQPHVAHGRLTIAGQTIETDLPFALTVQDDVAQAQGRMRVDRRDFGIGAGYADEGTVGFGVEIGFALSAKQQ